MGMHHGVIAAKVPSARLIEVLNSHAPKLEAGAPAQRLDELALDATDAGFGLAFGERAGTTFIFDPSLILSADFDLMAAVSRDLGTTVLGWGAETVSGTYWFIACRDGNLVRGYWNCHMDMRAPWSRGPGLASETKQPFNGDLDGNGLAAGARELGFDFEDWLKNGPFIALSYEAIEFPAKGPLGEEFDRFHATVRIPEGQQPKITAVLRSAPKDQGSDKQERKGLRGLFGR